MWHNINYTVIDLHTSDNLFRWEPITLFYIKFFFLFLGLHLKKNPNFKRGKTLREHISDSTVFMSKYIYEFFAEEY